MSVHLLRHQGGGEFALIPPNALVTIVGVSRFPGVAQIGRPFDIHDEALAERALRGVNSVVGMQPHPL